MLSAAVGFAAANLLYGALRCFGVHQPVIPMVLAYASSYVISALPLPAGGAGGIDAGIALALHAIGIALAPALLATFVYRLFTFCCGEKRAPMSTSKHTPRLHRRHG